MPTSYVMKAITKVLMTWLQTTIHALVDADQTGFLSGHHISENIVYAADLLRCCHSRKAPTLVFKIDFRKAFDSVNWSSLLAILKTRGFDERWCLWMERILDTGHTAILLNGVPRCWIRCRNGLRQGDPLSPHLFIIVADVLQRLIRNAWASGTIAHPLSPDTPCPVLQCADDTLILCKASTEVAACLKQVLDDFALATGLIINFHKSCFIPMDVGSGDAASMATFLGCPISSFPQPYLGLPLSPTKLPASAFAPLSSPLIEGGFSIKDLHRQNRCLLLNFVHKLHQSNPLPWKTWFYSHTGRDLGDFSAPPRSWRRSSLSVFPSTVPSPGRQWWTAAPRPSGWISGSPGSRLRRASPPFSPTAPAATPRWPRWSREGWACGLAFIAAAESELLVIRRFIDGTSLRGGPDRRAIDSPSTPRFSSREAYRALSPVHPVDTTARLTWPLRIPTKVKIFAYLVDIDRLSTRVNLFYKSCAPSDICAACTSPETGRHLFFDCPVSTAIWGQLDVPIPAGSFSIWDLPAPPPSPSGAWHFGVAAILWSIWKSRNDLVFNRVTHSTTSTLRKVCDDLTLWRWRLRPADRTSLDGLRAFLLARAVA
nr:uncharacterized protein LOC127321619 [Lolium perenne]